MSKGIKTFLKVLYIGAGVLIIVFAYLLSYNSYTLSRIQNLANAAISEKNYTELERIFGSFFSTETIVTDTSADYDLVVYPATIFSTYKYKEADTEKTYERSDKGYYIYYISPKKDLVNDVTVGTTIDNHTGIKYSFTDGKEYTYYLQLSDTVNKNYYVAEPKTAYESALKGGRNLFTVFNYLNYFDISLSETLVNAMKEEIGSTGTVNKLTIVDSSGKDVDSYELDLSFNQPFYDNVNEYITTYNKYIDDYKAAEDNNKKSELTKAFETYFYGDNNNGFYYTFQNLANCGVARGREYIYPASLIWQSIGMCALVLLVLFLLYMLIFHFKLLKNLVYRVGNRNKNLGRAGLAQKNKKDLVKADYTELQKRNQNATMAAKAKVNDNKKKEEPKAEEVKAEEQPEEAKAEEIKEENNDEKKDE